jgi:hypothetical protein
MVRQLGNLMLAPSHLQRKEDQMIQKRQLQVIVRHGKESAKFDVAGEDNLWKKSGERWGIHSE